ncbi:MAG TPA: AAA family ATPase [Candidatus Paceibacterota bacterium]
MPTLKDFNPGAQIKALVYGMSKVGKTEGAATFPRPNFMDFDSGIATLSNPGFIKRHGWRPDIIYEQFTEHSVDARGVVKDHNAFDDACKYFDKYMGKDLVDTFDTWVIDTGTTLAEAAMNKALVLLGGNKGFSGAASNTLKMAQTHGLIVPKLQDYGSERSLVEQFVQMVKGTNKHVLLLCHEKETYDRDGNPTGIVPLLTGKGVEAICAMFDEIYNVRTRPKGLEREVYLQTVPDGIRKCGSRLGVPNGTAWTYDAVMESIKANNLERESLTHANSQP